MLAPFGSITALIRFVGHNDVYLSADPSDTLLEGRYLLVTIEIVRPTFEFFLDYQRMTHSSNAPGAFWPASEVL
jgi:hypothetical protein